MNHKRWSFFMLSLLVGLAGCGQRQHQKENLLLRSYRLIDENRSDDAIELLTEEVDRRDDANPEGYDPSNDTKDLRVCLASAYAKKSGLSIKEIIKAVQLGRDVQGLKIPDLAKFLPASKQTSTEKNINSLDYFLLVEIKTLETFEIIPKVDADKTIYLQQAVRTISSTKNLNAADHVYAAILKIVLTKTLLLSGDMGELLPQFEMQNNQCVANLDKFRDYLINSSKILIGGFEDLESAIPTQKEQYIKDKNLVVDLTTDLIAVNTAETVMNQTNKQTISYMYNAFGLGSRIKCESDADKM